MRKREAAIDVEALLAGHRMGAHDGMLGVGELDVVAVGGLDPVVVRLGAVVQRRQALQHLLDRLGERLVGAVRVGEQRVAAAVGRHLGEVEDRAHRRLDVADTSVCHSSPATCLDFSSALITRISGCSGNAIGALGWVCSGPKRRPNSLCCSIDIFWSRKKITRLSISASCTSWNCWLPSGLAEIDAEDLRADGRGELAHVDRLVGHVVSSGCWTARYAHRCRARAKVEQSPYCGLSLPHMCRCRHRARRAAAFAVLEALSRRRTSTLSVLVDETGPAAADGGTAAARLGRARLRPACFARSGATGSPTGCSASPDPSASSITWSTRPSRT